MNNKWFPSSFQGGHNWFMDCMACFVFKEWLRQLKYPYPLEEQLRTNTHCNATRYIILIVFILNWNVSFIKYVFNGCDIQMSNTHRSIADMNGRSSFTTRFIGFINFKYDYSQFKWYYIEITRCGTCIYREIDWSRSTGLKTSAIHRGCIVVGFR